MIAISEDSSSVAHPEELNVLTIYTMLQQDPPPPNQLNSALSEAERGTERDRHRTQRERRERF